MPKELSDSIFTRQFLEIAVSFRCALSLALTPERLLPETARKSPFTYSDAEMMEYRLCLPYIEHVCDEWVPASRIALMSARQFEGRGWDTTRSELLALRKCQMVSQ